MADLSQSQYYYSSSLLDYYNLLNDLRKKKEITASIAKKQEKEPEQKQNQEQNMPTESLVVTAKKDNVNMATTSSAITTNATTAVTKKSLANKIVSDAKEDIIDGLWRTAAEQTVKTVREPVIQYSKNKFGDSTSIVVETLINTSFGESVLQLPLEQFLVD